MDKETEDGAQLNPKASLIKFLINFFITIPAALIITIAVFIAVIFLFFDSLSDAINKREKVNYAEHPAVLAAIQEIENNSMYIDLLGEDVKASYAPTSNIKFLGSNEKASFKLRAESKNNQKLLFIKSVNGFKEGWGIVEISAMENDRLVPLFKPEELQHNDVYH